ncbi:MAG TPA: cupin domain-containing protein [Chloroflexia bacterium]|nr:cupin domain-containing protein [Chloroflexia bacterium]
MAEGDGVRVVRANERSNATPQTRGMTRVAGIAPETTGNQGLWMGLVTSPGGMVSAWHHHGDCETGIYLMQGRARFRWGRGGKESAEVGPGDFISVPPMMVHMEETLSEEDAVFVVARACNGVVVVNVEGPEPE